MPKYDVAIVGGGVAGLMAAVYAAKAGKRAIVVEKQERLGGRAITNRKNGAYFSLGGHALYEGGEAMAAFREWGMSLPGKQPSIDASGIWKGKLLTLPTGFSSLFATPLLSWRGKLELASWLAKLARLDTRRFDQVSLREWIEGGVSDPMVRHLFYSLLRTASYAAAPDLQAAGPALRQLQSALKGVLYLDRGWGTLVEELAAVATRHGVTLMAGGKAAAVEHSEGAVRRVLCADGTRIEAASVIIASPPAVARDLVQHAEATALRTWAEQAIEVTAATLDVALRRLPRSEPKRQLVYGIDQPVFLSNQSRAAHLSDDGAQVISLINYQGGESDPQRDLQTLEQTLDLVQPGWRGELVAKQFLPRITVHYDFMHLKRRELPGPAVPEIAGLYVAGDWASHGEMLVDAAAASAKRAVEHLLRHERGGEGAERKAPYEHRIIV